VEQVPAEDCQLHERAPETGAAGGIAVVSAA
jgi:hypothetical protein